MAKKNSFMKNASFLMMATMISRIIGLLYRSPLGRVVGSVGLGYYGYANSVYVILLLISSYSIPMAISKVVSERLALKQYKNAFMVFKGALLYAVVIGAITAGIAFFGGTLLLPPNQSEALLALRVLAPTIFLSAILGVLRGYFQAYNTMAPTSISQVLEQLINAIVSVLAAWMFIGMFATDDTSKAIYGAAGGTLGTGAGVLIALIFMAAVYLINKKTIQRQIASDRSSGTESMKDVLKIIILMVTPVIFSTFVYNANTYFGGYLFDVLMGRNGVDKGIVSQLYGEFTSYYTPLISIPLALSSATSSAMMPEISAMYARKDVDGANNRIHTGISLTMFICIPAAVGLGVLAFPIIRTLYPASSTVSGYLLMFGAVSVIFTALSTITNSVLQAIGKPRIPLINAAVSLAVNVVSLVAMLWFSSYLNIYAVLISNTLFSVSMCILNQISLYKYLGYKNQFLDAYGKPLLAAAGMGVTAWIVYYGLHLFVPIRLVCLGIAVLLAVVVYLILYVVITKTSEYDLGKFPFGKYMIRFMRVIRIYK